METCYTYRLKKNTCRIIHCYILKSDWLFRHYIRVQKLCHSNVIFKLKNHHVYSENVRTLADMYVSTSLEEKWI